MGIKNSRWLWSIDAIDIIMVSIVSSTDVYTGLWAKNSNSDLTDNAFAAMPTSRMKALGKDFSFYILFLNSRRFFPAFALLRLSACPLSLFRTLCAESRTFLRTTSRNFASGPSCQLVCFCLQLVPRNPRPWHRARAMDAQTNATDHLEYCRFHDRAE